jgi:5-deoxy-glucuronate isomerase
MSQLLVHPHQPDASGCVLEVTPHSAGWRHVGFKVCRLAPGQRLTSSEAQRETCIVVLSGSARVSVDAQEFGAVGGRSSVFEDVPPGAVYAPAGAQCSLEGLTEVEFALCTAPGKTHRMARMISPASMAVEVRGQGTNTRRVRNILPETEPADSLLVVEVITPAGHWSSYPPHKHDSAVAGEETALEETYYHRIDPPQGFAFQRVYTDDRTLDETLCVSDGDVVLVPRGYHPVGAPHGYNLYYLNVMAGPARKWMFRNDPAHAWIVRQR